MNILIVARGIPTDDNPMHGIFEFDQAKALFSFGHHVTYFALDLRSFRHWRKYGIRKENRNGIEVFVYSLPVGALLLPIKLIIGKRALKKLFKHVYQNRETPDIIHAHFAEYGFISSSLSNEKNIPLIITEHSSLMCNESVPRKILKCANRAYHEANKVIAVSNSLSNNIYEYTGIRTAIIYNIVDATVFTKNRTSIRSKYRFVSVGNLIPRKGMDILIHAFALFHSCHPNSELVIIGTGPEKESLLSLVKELDIQENVTLLGALNREAIANHFREADCFVLASKGETFGVVYAEAMMAGLPVIATRCGGPEAFVTDNVGIMVEPNSIDSLFDGMNRMFSFKAKYDQTYIHNYAQELFAPHEIAEKLSVVYEAVLREDNYD